MADDKYDDGVNEQTFFGRFLGRQARPELEAGERL